jgi:hypothetical protein
MRPGRHNTPSLWLRPAMLARRLGLIRLALTRLDLTRLALTRLELTRLDLTGLRLTRLGGGLAWCLGPLRRRHNDRGPVTQSVGAVGHHPLTGLQTGQHSLVVAIHRTHFDGANRNRVVGIDHIDERARHAAPRAPAPGRRRSWYSPEAVR